MNQNNKKTLKITLVVALLLVGVVTCIHPVFPRDQFLQHIGTVLLLVPLVADLKNNCLPMVAFAGITLFTFLHIIGARYTYSYVPYKDWCISLGLVEPDFFQDPRNYYDRLVHFSFGLLSLPYFVYQCRGRLQLKPAVSIFVAWLMVQSCSMVYELFEWLLTIVVSPEAADSYNGQQGDIWDAQKDMGLALVGSTVAALFFFYRHKRLCPKE